MESGSTSHSCNKSSDVEPPGKNMQFSEEREIKARFIFLPSIIEELTYII